MTNINALPDEVLQRIFFYLEKVQRLEAALVCKRWLSALNCPQLTKDFCVDIDKKKYKQLSPQVKPTRMFGYFRFSSLSLDRKFLKFMETYGDFIHTLSFCLCRVNRKEISVGETVSVCAGLKNLRIFDNFLDILGLFSSLHNLEQLGIEDCQFKGHHLQKLQDLTANLKSFHLGSVLTFDSFGGSRSQALSTPLLTSFITKNCKTFEELEVYHLQESHALAIASISGLRLKKIRFPQHYKPSLIIEICRRQPSLTSLHIHVDSEEEDYLKNSYLEEIVHLLPNLQCLHLESCFLEELSPVLELKQLKKLTFTECRFFKKCVPRTFSSVHLKTFRCFMSDTTPSMLTQLFLGARYIQDLCLEGVSDKEMWMITSTLKCLKTLKLDECVTLTDRGLTGQRLPRGDSAFPPAPISNLRGLTKLTISRNENITEEGVIQAIQFPFLVHLELDHCRNITPYIEPDLIKRNPCLRKCDVLK